jgi:hypothetical protein
VFRVQSLNLRPQRTFLKGAANFLLPTPNFEKLPVSPVKIIKRVTIDKVEFIFNTVAVTGCDPAQDTS